MTRQEQQTRKAQKEIDAFNERAPVGTAVLYWTGLREGPGREGRIRHLATILSGHTAVAWVDTHPACVALTHVEVVDLPLDDLAKAEVLAAASLVLVGAYLALWKLLDVLAKEQRGVTDLEAQWIFTEQPKDVWEHIRRLGLDPTQRKDNA